MTLSDFEIGKIAEIVAGKSGTQLDAKALRQVIDRVVDQLNTERGNPEIEGATCEIGTPVSSQPVASSTESIPEERAKREEVASPQGGLYEQIEKTDKTRVIIASFGKDRPGVGAALTSVLAECNCSIEDISQTLLQDFFSMIMIVNIDGSTVDFSGLRDRLQQTETQLGMKVYVMHEDIFRYMHRI